jgi:hypothetical protein
MSLLIPSLDANDSISRIASGDRHANFQKTWVSYPIHLDRGRDSLFGYVRPRIILVEDHGVLSGLVSVKDVLKFIATEKLDQRPSWDERGGLDGLLEEIWTWASRQVSNVLHWSRRSVEVRLGR